MAAANDRELELALEMSRREAAAANSENDEAALLASMEEAERAQREEEEMARIVSMQEAQEESAANFLEKMNGSNPNRRKRLIAMAAINSKLHQMRMSGNENVANVQNAWEHMQGNINSAEPLNSNAAYQTASALSANVNDNIHRRLVQKNKNMTNAEAAASAAAAARVQETLRQMAAERESAAASAAAAAAADKARLNAARKAAMEARYGKGPNKKGGRRALATRRRSTRRRATRRNRKN